VVRSRLWSVADAGRLAASDLGGHALRAAISPSRDIRVGLEDTTVLDVEGLAGSLKAGVSCTREGGKVRVIMASDSAKSAFSWQGI
jgi:hypothetical protein